MSVNMDVWQTGDLISNNRLTAKTVTTISTTPSIPLTPQLGQPWFDLTNNVFKTYQGVVYDWAPMLSEIDTAENLLLALGQNTVVSVMPQTAGNYMFTLYFSVVSASTNISVIYNWTDGIQAQTFTLISNSARPSGNSYTMNPLYVYSTTSGSMSIIISTSAANRVYASANIITL